MRRSAKPLTKCFSPAKRWWGRMESQRMAPDADAMRQYAEGYGAYQRVYQALKGIHG